MTNNNFTIKDTTIVSICMVICIVVLAASMIIPETDALTDILRVLIAGLDFALFVILTTNWVKHNHKNNNVDKESTEHEN